MNRFAPLHLRRRPGIRQAYHRVFTLLASCVLLRTSPGFLPGAENRPAYPPALPNDASMATDRTPAFLTSPGTLREGTRIAKTPPTIEFTYYPEQTYPGHPWSVWGDGVAATGKYYSSIGDHLAPRGNAFVYEYDPETRKLRTLVNVRKVLDLPEGHYTPGKIHSRIDLGSDGWLYFGTHRGSTRVTTDQYHYQGDWILRHDPKSGRTEIVAHGPVPKHCIPSSVLDPDRLIFYGGTAPGNLQDPVMFFAYDIRQRKVLSTVENGPYRYLLFARSTGRVYYVHQDEGPLMRFDPAHPGPPTRMEATLGLRAATQETPDGYVHTISTRGDGRLWRFQTRTETSELLGSAAVGTQDYVASLDADPTGRYLYYVPGAHGGGQDDGAPVVQFDVATRTRKVLAFLHPFYRDHYGFVPLGTFSSAVSEQGDKLYITWNGNRGGPDARGRWPFDTCALTILHIPAEERP